MKLYITIIILFFCGITSHAQDALAKIEYGYAEEAFQNKEFQKTITHLNKVKELLKSTNATVMYLEILASYQLLPVSDAVKGRELKLENDSVPRLDNKSKTLLADAEAFQNIDQLTSKFLKSFSETAPLEKTKAVYAIQKNIASSTIGIKDVVEALKALDSSNYTQAIALLNKACTAGNQFACTKIKTVVIEKEAYNGDAESMVKLGDEYFLKENYIKALEWYDKAVIKGHTKYLSKIGLYNFFGREGVARDIEKAKSYWEIGIEKGDVECMYSLGMFYYRNREDIAQRIYWLEKAANMNHKDAMLQLQILYLTKHKDNKKSKYWKEKYKKALAENVEK